MEPLTEAQFHTVWTEAIGKVGYCKQLFQLVLQNLKDKGMIIEDCITSNEKIPKKFFKGDKITVLSGEKPFVTHITNIKWDELNKAWKYYFIYEDDDELYEYEEAIENFK